MPDLSVTSWSLSLKLTMRPLLCNQSPARLLLRQPRCSELTFYVAHSLRNITSQTTPTLLPAVLHRHRGPVLMAKFTDLSTEERCMIYEYLFAGTSLQYRPPIPPGAEPFVGTSLKYQLPIPPNTKGRLKTPTQAFSAVSILFTSRQIYSEARECLLKEATIDIMLLFTWPAVRRKITTQMNRTIRHAVLRLDTSQMRPSTKQVESGVRKMSNLKSLVICVPSYRMTIRDRHGPLERGVEDSEQLKFHENGMRCFLTHLEHVRVVRAVIKVWRKGGQSFVLTTDVEPTRSYVHVMRSGT